LYFIVDQETYLHQEKDPRYRGAAIPSRAFRFLQNMTESNDGSVTGKIVLYTRYFYLKTFMLNFIKKTS